METLTKPSTANNSLLKVIFTILFVALPFLGFYLGMQYQNLVTEPIAESLQVPTTLVRKPTPTPKPGIDETANWKTYKGTIFEFKYPLTWSVTGEENNLIIYDKELKNASAFNFMSKFIMIIYSDDIPNEGVILSDSIGTKKEIADKVFEEKIANIDLGGKQAVKAKIEVLPGSQTNTISGLVVVTAVNNKNIFLRLLYQSDKNTPQELENYYNQILSTFKFTDNSTVPTPTPTKNITTLKYNLPSGWITVNDKDNQFSIGYDPQVYDVNLTYLTGYISLVDKSRNTYASVGVFPYDGGSRHTFIFKQMGQPQTKGDEPEAYREVEYMYNGRSCLFLENLYISMSPSIWGMCDVGDNRALLFNSYELDYQTILQTFKLLK